MRPRSLKKYIASESAFPPSLTYPSPPRPPLKPSPLFKRLPEPRSPLLKPLVKTNVKVIL